MLKKIFVITGLFLSLSVTQECVSYSSIDCNGVPFDQKLTAIMNYRNGVFIEVGANDGVTQSNTKLFEECYGWTGVLIEPSPNLYPILCQNRLNSKCYQCALGSFEEDGSFVYGDFDGATMSSVNGERRENGNLIKVPMRSLQSILDELNIRHIDFISLDTEGYELNILRGIDFTKTEIEYFLIEIYNTQFIEIIDFLHKNGFELTESFSNYNKTDNPHWDGTHNDYLFKRKKK